MKDVLVCWSGIETRPWRDASAFVLRINRLGGVAYIDLDRTTFPERHLAALAKCCLWRWKHGNDWFVAQTSHVGHGPRDSRVISVTARVLGVVEPERVED